MRAADTSRRSLLAVMAAAPLITAFGPAAAASSTADPSEWNRVFAKYTVAAEAADRAEAEWMELEKRYNGKEPDPKEIIDWNTLGIPYSARPDHTARFLDVEQDWQTYLDGQGKWWWAKDPVAAKARQRAAFDTILTYRKAAVDFRRDTGLEEASDRADRLGDEAYALKWTLMELPAPHGPALFWKLGVLLQGDAVTWSENALSPVKADARRLLNGEA